MKIAVKLIFITSVLASVGCSTVSSSQNNQYETALSARVRSRHRVLVNLRLALSPSSQWARINYHDVCRSGRGGDLLFPDIDAQAPLTAGKGIKSIREIFRNNSNVKVFKDKSGVVQITIGHVSGKILNTKIIYLKLNQRAQYNPGGLVGAIPSVERTPEYRAAFKRLKLRHATVFFIGGVEQALKSLPHLPTFIKNVTVGEVYDMIAKTFKGVVIYGECTKPNGEIVVDSEFYPL